MLVLKIAAGIILAVVLLAVGCSVLVASGDTNTIANAPAFSGKASSPDNAQKSAEQYVSHQAFSRSGLIEQLKFEGYSDADATAAVDEISPDWNEQAAKSAAQYLSLESFSRSGLREQLEFDGFSASEAEYGVNQTYAP